MIDVQRKNHYRLTKTTRKEIIDRLVYNHMDDRDLLYDKLIDSMNYHHEDISRIEDIERK